jgi:DNA repair photolyase
MKPRSGSADAPARTSARIHRADHVDHVHHKGRGATINPAARDLPTRTVPVHDGWDLPGEPDSAPVTRFFADRTVSIITRNRSPDVPFDRSINAYRGCEHGCVYCFARPTHAWLDLSPGLDFETRIFYKTNVRERLRHELGRRGYRCQPIAMGTNTDPYQPVERRLGITREILGVALECRHPVTIVTKSHLVARDLDLLMPLARQSLVTVMLSVTTLDNGLKAILEPRAASPAARLRTIERLAEAGVPVGALIAPVIPFVNDDELEAIVARTAAAGAGAVRWILLRLPLEVLPLFEAWLDTHYPLKKARVMSAMRDMHGGRAYESAFGVRMRGRGPFAELLARRFDGAV